MREAKQDLSEEVRQAEAKREVEAVAAEVVEKAMAWHAEHPRVTIAELEEEILRLR